MKDVKIRITADTSGAKGKIDGVARSTKKLDRANGKAAKSNNSLSAATVKTGTAMGGVATASTTATTSIAALGGSVGAAAGGMSALKTRLQAVIVSLKSVKVAMMATGIGLVIVLLASLRAAFTRSEEGQDKFAKAMAAIGAVTGVLMDGLAAFGSLIIDVFTKPRQVFEDFSKSIKEFVTDKIAKVTEGLGLLGSAIKKAFSGDFSGALDDAKSGLSELNDGLNPVKMGVDALADGVKGLVKEMKEEAKIAGQIADMRAAADKADRALIIERSKANRDRADLLNKAMDKENFSAKERIAFLEEAGKIEEKITNQEIAATELRVKAKRAENALGLSTKADKDELANLEAKLIDLETSRLSKAKLVTSQISALIAQERAEKKKLADDAIAIQKELDDFNANTQEEKRQVEKDKLQAQFDDLMEKAGDNNEAKIELQKSYDERLLELKNKHADDDAKAQKVIDDKKEADDEAKRSKEIADIQAVADAEEAIQTARLGTIKSGLGLLAQLGEESKAVKAAALIGESAVGIAEMSISRGKADALADIQIASPNPLMQANGLKAKVMNKINLGMGIASNVAATAKGLAALGAGGAPSAGGQAGGTSAPSFNLVEGTESNAIQNTINGAGNKPVKAYVTSGDVTTAQQADRQAELNSGF